jgi:peroxiredoxin
MRREPSRLANMTLPDVRLRSFRRGSDVSLGRLVAAPLVIYLYPGTPTAPGEGKQTPQLDRAQHRGYRTHAEDLTACGYQAIGISSQPTWAQAESIAQEKLSHELLSDPELLLGDALGLPSFQADEATRAYHRLTLIAKGGIILKAFASFAPGHNATQVSAWLWLH